MKKIDVWMSGYIRELRIEHKKLNKPKLIRIRIIIVLDHLISKIK